MFRIDYFRDTLASVLDLALVPSLAVTLRLNTGHLDHVEEPKKDLEELVEKLRQKI